MGQEAQELAPYAFDHQLIQGNVKALMVRASRDAIDSFALTMGQEEPLADFDLRFKLNRCQVAPELLPVIPVAEIPEEENGIVLSSRLPEGNPIFIQSLLDRGRVGCRTILIGI